MKIVGDRAIEVPRHETFRLGRDPELWRRASSEGPLFIYPREKTPFKQGDIIDVAIDTNAIALPWIARKVVGKKPLEPEAVITEMQPNKRIQITGGLAIIGFGLEITLHDSQLGDNHTATGNRTFVEYSLEIETLGPLSRFNGMLGNAEEILQNGADRLIENLAIDIQSCSRAA